jgi:CRISPR-associated protein Csb1
MDFFKNIATAAAIRLQQQLQPEGGPGDKIFPPTFEGGVYCWEQRRVEGRSVPCVLLDSVASQANRLEDVLSEAVGRSEIQLPRLVVKFAGDLADLGDISTLAAPHRVFDAILRDSTYDGKPFFKSALYLEFAACNVHNATALFAHSPSALLFGCWDSTGAAGGLGNKFARAVTSEVVGINADWGVTQGGVRQDPLGVRSGVEIAVDDAGEWSLVGKTATGKKERAKGTRPSEINHGNILIEPKMAVQERVIGDKLVSQRQPLKGGVTVDHALQTSVISLNALRRLRFPINGSASVEVDIAARGVLAALALAALVLGRERGSWLRSRCGLVADGARDFEFVRADGSVEAFAADRNAAIEIYGQALETARKCGLPWHPEPVLLEPQQKLIDLIKKSREIQSLSG